MVDLLDLELNLEATPTSLVRNAPGHPEV